jgi:HSP20 family molecular chaperone IbpA
MDALFQLLDSAVWILFVTSVGFVVLSFVRVVRGDFIPSENPDPGPSSDPETSRQSKDSSFMSLVEEKLRKVELPVVESSEDGFKVRFADPRIREDNVDVSVQDGNLTIYVSKGEARDSASGAAKTESRS